MPDRQVNTKSMRLIIRTDVRDREFFSSTGPVAAMTRHAAELVHDTAKRLIGFEYSGSWNNNRGGKSLSESGRVVRSRIGGPNFDVVFTHRAAVVHHTGARSHVFNPNVKVSKKTGAVYSNIWRHKGRGGAATPYPHSARAPFVHPGHKGNPYLTDAGREVGLRVSQSPGGPTGTRPGIGRIPRGFV